MDKVNVMTHGNPGTDLTNLEPGGKVHEECPLGVYPQGRKWPCLVKRKGEDVMDKHLNVPLY